MGWLSFGLVSTIMLGSAVRAVTCNDLIRSVLWLAGALLSTAVIYAMLHADFLAIAQIILYTGGIITLMLFGVMLTFRLADTQLLHGSSHRTQGAVLAAAMLGLIGTAIYSMGAMPFPELGDKDFSTQPLGALFLGELMLPFELISILLLAAMIGAITLARKVDP